MQDTQNEAYPIPAGISCTEFEVKRSKFLTFVGYTSTRQTADSFVRDLREKYPKANHVCWAYIVGSPKSTTRSMSDDGEPSGTAGMPILKVLEHSGFGDIVVAVVRHFGGVKLGTGGLQRAYSDAVSIALSDLSTKMKVQRRQLNFAYDYVYEGAISRLLGRYDIDNIITTYEQQVSASAEVASNQVDKLEAELINITGGSINIEKPPL